MKERLVTLGLALGAFALFYAFFVPKPAQDDSPALPVSVEIRGEGYQALWRWLSAQAVPVVSLRDRYDRLGRQPVPDTGNLLVATLPQQDGARRDELQALDAWVRRGNTLLVVAALDDTPGWSARSSAEFLNVIQEMTGLRFVTRSEAAPPDSRPRQRDTAESVRDAVQAMLDPRRSMIRPRGRHPLFEGVDSLVAVSEFPASRWVARQVEPSPALELAWRDVPAADDRISDPAMWLKRRGDGQIIVLAFASPFSNALIGEADNARLFANIVAWSRGAQGVVLFDDVHQGLVNYYDAKAFFGDPRLHRTLLWLCALWLLYVLGWQRLRPRTDAWNPVDVTTFIKVTGGFIAGKVPAGQAGARLIANFFNRIRQRLSLPPDGEPLWGWLDAQAGVSADDLQQLRQLHARVRDGGRVDLVQLQNCLARITGSLA